MSDNVEATQPETTGEDKIKIKKGKKRADLNGLVTIRASFNNTIITVTDVRGNSVSWSSGGKVGFKGSRKSTPFAAQLAGEDAGKIAYDLGMRKVEVKVRGAGAGRESAVRALRNANLEVTAIKDLTGVPHNGCRPKKRRRV
jgi:small subunit ribosomal protein S11